MEDTELELRMYKSAFDELTEENVILIKFIESFISDFEGDYMMSDGRIVDNPSTLLLIKYEHAKRVIQKVKL